LRMAARAADRLTEAELETTGLTARQMEFLIAIDANPGLSIVRIGESIGVDRSTTSQVIGALRKRKLVQSTESKEDGRVKVLEISDTGKAILKRCHAAQVKVEKRIGSVPCNRHSSVRDFLERVVEMDPTHG
jgi:DNA-binding MarR family transcriptional regulator